MIKEIKVPQAGQTTDEVVVLEWKVKAGDRVKRGDVLVDLETDKAVLQVESYAEGIILDLLAKEGERIDGGALLALVGDEKDKAEYRPGGKAAPENTGPLPGSPAQSRDEEYMPIMKRSGLKADQADKITGKDTIPRAMPNAKRRADELGIEIMDVPANGGRIINRHDVEAFAAAEKPGAKKAGENSAGAYQVFPMTRMRQAIGRRMLESAQTIPVFHASVEIEMTEAIKIRGKAKQYWETAISFNDIIVKVISAVSMELPLLRSRFEENEIRIYGHAHIGIAVSLDDGLIVPVIRNAEQYSLRELAKTSKALIEKARKGELQNDEMGTGNMTVSNLGMYGISRFDAIINSPECCIFAVGAIIPKPVLKESAWTPVPFMSLTASFDHRIIDGAYGAEALRRIKQRLEDPCLLII